MDGFRFDEEKAVNVVLFILQKLGKVKRHMLAKILYFADQKHLIQYGRPILGDTYIAMRYGPVPSAIYDGIKSVDECNIGSNLFKESIGTSGNLIVYSKKTPDMDELSKSEIVCLNESISENKDLSFDELYYKSHKLAWNSASANGRIPIKKIAEEGGATKDMLDHILDSIHDIHLSRHYGLIS